MDERREIDDKAILAGLGDQHREKLRRIVLVSTENDWAIAQQVQGNCNSFHVQAMRRRLKMLGVLPTVIDEAKPRAKSRPKDCDCELRDRQWNPETRMCGNCGRKYPKYKNAELFEDVA